MQKPPCLKSCLSSIDLQLVAPVLRPKSLLLLVYSPRPRQSHSRRPETRGTRQPVGELGWSEGAPCRTRRFQKPAQECHAKREIKVIGRASSTSVPRSLYVISWSV